MVRNKNGCESCRTETVHIIEITLCSQQIVNDEFQPVRAFRNFQTLNFSTIPVRVRENGKTVVCIPLKIPIQTYSNFITFYDKNLEKTVTFGLTFVLEINTKTSTTHFHI